MSLEIGRIELGVGPMFSGKSEWLLGRLKVHKFAGHSIVAIRPAIDNRYSQREITSHNRTSFEAETARDVRDIEELMRRNGKVHVLGVDEIQFFNPELADFFDQQRREGVLIYATGLDLDFSGEPWPTTNRVMAFANRIEKHLAVCSVCRRVNATRTQRLIDGMPAPRSSPKVFVGGIDAYTARCEEDYEFPD